MSIHSNIKVLGGLISRKEIAKQASKKYIKDGVETLKQGVSLTTVTEWYKQGFAPLEYHKSIVAIKANRDRITLDDLYMDLRNKIL